jgi:trk system potassium uptake protein TrkH
MYFRGRDGSALRARRSFSPAQVLVLSFLVLIGVGTLLLRLPLTAAAEPLSLLDALFTATSAVCVTGLIVVDTPQDLSVAGQLVVLGLIQLGGLGYMAVTTVAAVALGRQLTVQERLTLQEALNVQSMEGLLRFVFTVLKLTLAFELTGALVLTAMWADDFGVGRASYLGLFHAVSAFNNAGFSLFSDSLVRFRGDWIVNLVITTLVICGGLGFVVLTELGRVRQQRRLSTHTRLVLLLTIALIAGATLAIFLIERRNPATLASLSLPEALLAAYFQAVTPRTAGFNTLDIGAMLPASLFLLIILMFIGAAPGGTAGGVKISTFSVTVAAIWAMIRNAPEPTLLRRRIAPALVARAF